MVGLRAPAYKKTAERRAYWAELSAIMDSARDRPILFAGDVYFDPFAKAKRPGAESVPFHLCDGYAIPNPAGEWSYLGHRGHGSRIDHVIHTPHVSVESPEYIDWIRGRFLAGPKVCRPISDHAVLRFEVRGSNLEGGVDRRIAGGNRDFWNAVDGPTFGGQVKLPEDQSDFERVPLHGG